MLTVADAPFLCGIAESYSARSDACYGRSSCPSVCLLSVTLVHPAKAIRQNEMRFGRDTDMAQSNIV